MHTRLIVRLLKHDGSLRIIRNVRAIDRRDQYVVVLTDARTFRYYNPAGIKVQPQPSDPHMLTPWNEIGATA